MNFKYFEILDSGFITGKGTDDIGKFEIQG